jgi:hypothetical protein
VRFVDALSSFLSVIAQHASNCASRPRPNVINFFPVLLGLHVTERFQSDDADSVDLHEVAVNNEYNQKVFGSDACSVSGEMERCRARS